MRVFLYENNDEEIKAKSHKEAGRILQDLPPNKNGYVITAKKNLPIRSNAHNRYYRVVLKIIAIKTGETSDRLDMLFHCLFHYEEFILPNGDVRRIPKTTSNDDVAEFARYVNQVKQYAIDEWGCYFPDLHDFDRMKEIDIEDQYERIQG